MFRGSETVISRIFNFVRKALLHSTAAMYLREHCSWLYVFKRKRIEKTNRTKYYYKK